MLMVGAVLAFALGLTEYLLVAKTSRFAFVNHGNEFFFDFRKRFHENQISKNMYTKPNNEVKIEKYDHSAALGFR